MDTKIIKGTDNEAAGLKEGGAYAQPSLSAATSTGPLGRVSRPTATLPGASSGACTSSAISWVGWQTRDKALAWEKQASSDDARGEELRAEWQQQRNAESERSKDATPGADLEDGKDVVVVAVGEAGGQGLPALLEHFAERVNLVAARAAAARVSDHTATSKADGESRRVAAHQLGAIVRLGVVRRRHHDADGGCSMDGQGRGKGVRP